jgi:hypothetical protein
MIFIFSVAQNVTAALHFESVHRFKTLQLCRGNAPRLGETPGRWRRQLIESFPLREMRLAVSLRTFAAPTVLETSAD